MFRSFAASAGSFLANRPVAPYALVLLGVEALCIAYYGLFEPERLPFELLFTGLVTMIVAFPTIALMRRQHRIVSGLRATLEQASGTDAATGLPNRQGLTRVLDELVSVTPANVSAGSFARIDIDRLKQINMRHGRETGDRLVELLGMTIRASVRSCDLVARLGGGEFGVFLTGASLEQAGEAVARVKEAIDAARRQADLPEASVSIGIAAHRAGEEPAIAMREADESLVAAQAAGQDCVVIELRKYRAG